MTGHEVVKRLKAFQAGTPLPLGETLRVRVLTPQDTLLVAFVRMGGESAPWGVAFGHPGAAPRILTVPEPRNRDLVAEMVAEFAPTLLRHLQHSAYGGPHVEAPDQLVPRQLWLPNASHLDMLQNLAYTYTFTKFGSPKRYEVLNQLGRAAGWLFREAHRPGQTAVMVATDVLKQAYTFPAEDIRQGHLGFLLAWLKTRGDRAARMRRAETAERVSISTSLNPDEERGPLADAVDGFNGARSEKNAAAQKRIGSVIDGMLRAPLERRFSLTADAIDVIRKDSRRPNGGLEVLEKASRDEQYRQYLRIEYKFEDPEDGPPFVPSPETDRYPAAAASRFYVQESSQQLVDGLLVHDDRDLQAEMIAEGKAIRGRITDVRDEDPGRKTVPVWTLDADATVALHLRENADVCVIGCPKRQGVIRDITQRGGRYRIEIQITTCVTVPRGDSRTLPATSPQLKGQVVTLVQTTKDGIARMKSQKVWDRNVVGKRLTHLRPSGLRSELPDDLVDETASEA